MGFLAATFVVIGIILGTFFLKVKGYVLGKEKCGNCVCDKGEENNCDDCKYDFNDNVCSVDEIDWIAKNILNAGKCQTSYCVERCKELFEKLREYEIAKGDTSEIISEVKNNNCTILCEKIWKETRSEEILESFGCYHYSSSGDKIYIKDKDDI